MAVVYISEYSNLAMNGNAPISQEPPLAEQTVAIGGSSAQSAAFNANTRYIRVHTDAICSVLIGTNPTATAEKKRLPADSVEYFGVSPGSKLAVITNV
jgi:hypothetical protein